MEETENIYAPFDNLECGMYIYMHRINHFADGTIDYLLSTIHDKVINLSLTQLKDKLSFH